MFVVATEHAYLVGTSYRRMKKWKEGNMLLSVQIHNRLFLSHVYRAYLDKILVKTSEYIVLLVIYIYKMM